MKRVGNIIIPFSKLQEKFGEPNRDSGWQLDDALIAREDDSIVIESNKCWNVHAKSRDTLIKIGDQFKRSDRIIY